MAAKILEIEHLAKSYDGKKFALKDCSFALERGSICAVVGESGSGKSTLLRLIAGLERPNQGTIKIKGEVVSDDRQIKPAQKRQVGFVFQDYALFPHLTVTQNIAFGIKNNKTNPKQRVKELLQLIKMEDFAKVYPVQLSGGQQQRVAMARTLALNPELLLMDEPFSKLDAGLKSALRKEIRTIVKNIGTSMIFITHDFMDALDIADEIIFLKDGHLVQHGPMSDFAQKAQHQEIQQMITDLKINAQRLLELI